MQEIWILKTADGEEYRLNTTGDCSGSGDYDSVYNLLAETTGHHGIPVTILSDPIPEIAGLELRSVVKGTRTVYLPLRIVGTSEAALHRNVAKLRRSLLNPDADAQLWVTNGDGETRVIYVQYQKGFESVSDGTGRGRYWIKVPLYVEALDPYFYDPPGAEIDRVFLPSPWSVPFFTATKKILITDSAHATDMTLTLSTTAGIEAGLSMEVRDDVMRWCEAVVVKSVDSDHQVTIEGMLKFEYYYSHGAYVLAKDATDSFLNDSPVLAKVVADAIVGEDHLTFMTVMENVTDLLPGDIVCITDDVDASKWEINEVDRVWTEHTIGLVNALTQTYATYDDETRLTHATFYRRVVNSACNFIIYWLRGCPPCYAAKEQLAAMFAKYPALEITYVEIQDAIGVADEHGIMNVGMTAAEATYPEGYAFAQACGPELPAFYNIIGTVMPAVITLYRNSIYIGGWCGVHTTQVDPVCDDVLLDAAGKRLYWRLGTSFIGAQVVVDNTGDDTAFPIWTIIGPGQIPRLRNVTTASELQLDHVLLEGETIIIDSRETAHTCGSNRSSGLTTAGYDASQKCPTCGGSGVIPASCVGCGGKQMCPTCKGTGNVTSWVPGSFGSSAMIGDMFNLRGKLASTASSFWGFVAGTNVLEYELSLTNPASSSSIEVTLARRYEGV